MRSVLTGRSAVHAADVTNNRNCYGFPEPVADAVEGMHPPPAYSNYLPVKDRRNLKIDHGIL